MADKEKVTSFGQFDMGAGQKYAEKGKKKKVAKKAGGTTRVSTPAAKDKKMNTAEMREMAAALRARGQAPTVQGQMQTRQAANELAGGAARRYLTQ